jgi:hypothetical protein
MDLPTPFLYINACLDMMIDAYCVVKQLLNKFMNFFIFVNVLLVKCQKSEYGNETSGSIKGGKFLD